MSILVKAPLLCMCVVIASCSRYRVPPSPETYKVPPPSNFEAADTNKDSVIDKDEAVAYSAQKEERQSYSFVILGWIIAACFLACLCTPGPVSYIKLKLLSLKAHAQSTARRLWEYIKKRTKKSS